MSRAMMGEALTVTVCQSPVEDPNNTIAKSRPPRPIAFFRMSQEINPPTSCTPRPDPHRDCIVAPYGL